MENEETDRDDLPDWVKDFLDKNELTDFVRHYLKKPVPYDTFKDWTFDELRAIKLRTDIVRHSKVSASHSTETDPIPLLFSPDEEDEIYLCDSDKIKLPGTLTSVEPDEVEEGERQYLIREIIRFYSRQVDASELAPYCPHLVRIAEYSGPHLESLRRLKTDQLGTLYGKLRRLTDRMDDQEG